MQDKKEIPSSIANLVVESGGEWGSRQPSGVSVMFMGEYQHALDSKGRLFIPVRLREELGERFIMTRGLDRCLFAYPLSEWARLEQKLKELPFTRSEARAFVRFFFAGAVECELDNQGRVLIPPALRSYAGIEKETAIIGVSTRVEIWSREVWETYSANVRDNYAEFAEKMVDFGV